jgi:hypothetical protein
VHGFPSLHAAPSVCGGFEQVPLCVSQIPAWWHWSMATHTTGLPPAHVPAWQVSVWVHGFWSSQGAVLFVNTHPVAGAHVSVVHPLLSSQTIAVPVHVPAPQVSPVVHALPSSHTIVLSACTHPVAGSHVSVVHVLWSLQSSEPAPSWQLPPAHASPVVHALPSSHAIVLLVNTQPVAGSQLSVVQMFPSLHTIGVPLHVPPPQVSPIVQTLPSSQAVVVLVCTQPVAGSQLSAVHALLSSQSSVPAPGWQLPPPQVSPVVQASPSSHGAVLSVCAQPLAGAHVSVVHGLLSLQSSVPAPG